MTILVVRCALLLLTLTTGRDALAHAPTFMTYSKFEATTQGRSIAFVFALDPVATSRLVERDVTHAPVDARDIASYRSFLSAYVFARFFVSNDGTLCDHAERLGSVFWDEPNKQVVAVTKFTCASDLADLGIRSYVTRDMPPSHELVGDVQHGRALVRNFFYGDDEAEAHFALASLPQNSEPIPVRRARHRGQFSYVPVPSRERKYEALAQAELGGLLPATGLAPPEASPAVIHFIGQGVLHILTGYDHLLFIVSLVLVVGSWRHLALLVTSFTAAHSLTLIVATFGWITPPSRLVEPLIALTVLAVAVEAIVHPNREPRWPVAFGFGLVHGLGLSSALRSLGLSGRDLVGPLLGFNLGVELGQLSIVVPWFSLLLLLRRNAARYDRVRMAVCSSVAVIAAVWVLLRVREAIAG
jgi:hydrogenase/urease accessory protein HupE